MADKATLTIGGRAFEVRPLTLDQIIDICPLFQTQAAGFATKESANAMVDIVAALLRRDYPDMTAEKIKELEGTPTELSAAVTEALILCGLVKREAPKKDAPPGEEVAGAN